MKFLILAMLAGLFLIYSAPARAADPRLQAKEYARKTLEGATSNRENKAAKIEGVDGNTKIFQIEDRKVAHLESCPKMQKARREKRATRAMTFERAMENGFELCGDCLKPATKPTDQLDDFNFNK